MTDHHVFPHHPPQLADMLSKKKRIGKKKGGMWTWNETR